MERVKVALAFYRNGAKYEVLDCTTDLRNWDDVTISLTRSDYTGVIRAISSKFEFVGDTKSKLEDYYNEYYLKTQIKINVYQLNEKWEYELIFSGDLDFCSVETDNNVFYINAKDNTLSSVIKANKSTKFDIPTADVRADKKLIYDRINILNRIQWTTDDADEETNEPYNFRIKQSIAEAGTYYIPFPLAYMSAETYRCPFEYKDQAQELIKESELDFKDLPGMIKVHDIAPFRINVRFSFNVIEKPQGKLSIILGKVNNPIISQTIIPGQSQVDFNAPIVNGQGVYGLYLKIEKLGTEIENLVIEYKSPIDKDGFYTRGSIAYAECYGKGNDVEYNCIDITKLLDALVKKIYPSASCIIDTLPFKCVLVGGEDMRSLNNAKITTSFNEFANFMEACFGFTYSVKDKTIRFGRREDLFSNEVVKEITSYSDLKLSQDTSLIYSRVKVGYNNQDYSNTNGKNEFNQSVEYSTDVNLTDNSFELISPYRADSYGFEFKTQEIENEVRDKTFSLEDEDKEESDNDMFIVEVEELDTHFSIARKYKSFIPSIVFSNNRYIGIKELFIVKDIKDLYGGGVFGNYYLTSYLKDTVETGIATFRFSTVDNSLVADIDNSIYINVPYRESGIEEYTSDKAIIKIDWDFLNQEFEEFNITEGVGVLNYPLSYACYNRNVFNTNLNPKFCVERNQFLIVPCTQELKFSSSDNNTSILFYGVRLFSAYENISFGGRDMMVNKITFSTDETILPANIDGKVRLITDTKKYEGWIINANQNIGRNEPSEYELILSNS